MKKTLCLVLCLVILTLSLTACGGLNTTNLSNNLPKGTASRIIYENTSIGNSTTSFFCLSNVEFEFVTDHLVKVECEDKIIYLPDDRILRIEVAEK